MATQDNSVTPTMRNPLLRVRSSGRNIISTVRRAVRYPGTEREQLLLIAKSTIAASLAWFLAHTVLSAPSSSFAPFTALFMVQSTIYRSLLQSLRYVLAVVVGVSLTALIGPLIGLNVLSFLLLVLLTLLIGYWRRLGGQGMQVSVAAVFAYAVYAQSGVGAASALQLLSIAGLVVLGAAVGITVNLVLFPPMRYRNAERVTAEVGDAVARLAGDIGCHVWQGRIDLDTAQGWVRQAQELSQQVEQAGQALEHANESSRFNPRRLFFPGRRSYAGGHVLLNLLQRVHDQLLSIARGLHYVAQENEIYDQAQARFLNHYAKVLIRSGQGIRHIGFPRRIGNTREREQLDRDVDETRRRYDELAHFASICELDTPGRSPIYGSMLSDLQRLVDEFEVGRDKLEEPASTA